MGSVLSPEPAVLTYDIGPGKGLGHRRRMEALSRALASRGVSTDLRPIEPPVEAPIVVVDSYEHRADDPSVCQARLVAAVDDLERDLDVTVLIEPLPGPHSTNHRATRVLTGIEYALVDPDLSLWDRGQAGDSPVSSILVTTGGTDAAGVGAHIAECLARRFPGIGIALVTGPWGSQGVPPGVRGLDGRNGIGRPLAQADLVVTAGGVTLLEALRLGRPTVVVLTSENQRRYVEAAHRAGAAVWKAPDDVPLAVESLVNNSDQRGRLSATARAFVDGRGPERVAQALLDLL